MILDVIYWDKDWFLESNFVWGSYVFCFLIFICVNVFLFFFYKNKL